MARHSWRCARTWAITVRPILLAGLLTTGAFGTASAQSAPTSTPTVDVTKLGPRVGEPVPDFTLLDQRGETRTLRSLMGPRGLVLVFSRSADW